MIFESHAHYDSYQYEEDRDQVIEKMLAGGVGTIINIGADMQGCRDSIRLAEQYPQIYATVGVHPDEVDKMSEQDLQELSQLADHKKVVAIGEIGLDYYRKEGDAFKEVQKKWFCKQLELAAQKDLPVVIHSRDAAEDTMVILRDYVEKYSEKDCPGVVHCYSYSPEMAKEYVKMGFLIGVGGVVTFKNAKKLVETVREIPITSILVETDSPYLAPEPHRGTRNDSTNIKYVIEKIAEIKEMDVVEVERITYENAAKMYAVT